jgi:hypothetical protein
MIGNFAVANLVPVNVLNLDVSTRGLHADQEPAVNGTGRDASVSSTHAAANDHVPGAVDLPYGRLTERNLAEYSIDTLFVVHCAGPLRRPVKKMIGGIEGWKDEGFALVLSSGSRRVPHRKSIGALGRRAGCCQMVWNMSPAGSTSSLRRVTN